MCLAYIIAISNIKDNVTTYQPTIAEIYEFLSHVNLPTLTPQCLTSLNTPFMAAEITKVIKNLPNNKSPGPLSLTGKYYKQF